jgi:hypothetical protein
MIEFALEIFNLDFITKTNLAGTVEELVSHFHVRIKAPEELPHGVLVKVILKAVLDDVSVLCREESLSDPFAIN